jgi:hypothetical protein
MVSLAIICYILVEESPSYYLCKLGGILSLTTSAVYNCKGEEQLAEIQKIIMGRG